MRKFSPGNAPRVDKLKSLNFNQNYIKNNTISIYKISISYIIYFYNLFEDISADNIYNKCINLIKFKLV